MTQHDTTRIGRRPVLKGAGTTLVGLAGLAGSATARGKGNGGGRGGGKQPLEETPSLTAALVFGGAGTTFPYPFAPVVSTFDHGTLFNTTSAEVTPSGQVIHYQLQFGVDSKPYVLIHEGDGQYTSKGSVINFELDGPDPSLGLPAGKYRATVRDVVQLYEKGGSFNWSVTRTDFFVRPGMDYSHSSLIIVWDEDTAENNDPTDRNTPTPANDPTFSEEVLGEAVYDAIDSNAKRLIAAGPSNPGGQ